MHTPDGQFYSGCVMSNHMPTCQTSMLHSCTVTDGSFRSQVNTAEKVCTVNPSYDHISLASEEMYMEISSCCGAPVIMEHQSDLSNFTGDEYGLKVPARVCSKRGAAVSGKETRHPRESD